MGEAMGLIGGFFLLALGLLAGIVALVRFLDD